MDGNENVGLNLHNLNPSDWSNYAGLLERKLHDIRLPRCADCRNVHCVDANHIAEIDEYATDILEAIDLSIKATAKRKERAKPKSKVVPGWNDDVKPYRENAMDL